MYEPCFDYHVQVDGDTVRISVSHHARGGNPTEVPVVFTLEVLVDLDIYERLRMANARIGVSYAGGGGLCNKGCSPGRGYTEWTELYTRTRRIRFLGSFWVAVPNWE